MGRFIFCIVSVFLFLSNSQSLVYAGENLSFKCFAQAEGATETIAAIYFESDHLSEDSIICIISPELVEQNSITKDIDKVLSKSIIVDSEVIYSLLSGDTLQLESQTDKKQTRFGKVFNSIFQGKRCSLIDDSIAADTIGLAKKKKLTAVLLTVFTGLLGGHRLYLGTKPLVPVVYAVTLGGGCGVLTLIDLVVILVSKDLSPYINNQRIIMWAK